MRSFTHCGSKNGEFIQTSSLNMVWVQKWYFYLPLVVRFCYVAAAFLKMLKRASSLLNSFQIFKLTMKVASG